MKINLNKIAKSLVTLFYTGIMYLGSMALVTLGFLAHSNWDFKCTDAEATVIIVGGAVIAIIIDYLANKFELVGGNKNEEYKTKR